MEHNLNISYFNAHLKPIKKRSQYLHAKWIPTTYQQITAAVAEVARREKKIDEERKKNLENI